MRMPAFAKWPNGQIPKGSETMEMVTTLDVLPTILGLLGMETSLPAGLDGVDVSNVFLGRTQKGENSSDSTASSTDKVGS